jgi:hypothetical protein
VSAIAKEHQGTAAAANHPDGGAVFALDLPAADGPPTEPTPAPAVKRALETCV